MRKFVILSSLAIVMASVFGMENIPSPSHSPKRNEVNVDYTITPNIVSNENLVMTNSDSLTDLDSAVQKFIYSELTNNHTANLVLSLFRKVSELDKKNSELESMNQILLQNQIILQSQMLLQNQIFLQNQKFPLQDSSCTQSYLNPAQTSTETYLQNSNIDLGWNQNVSGAVQTKQQLVTSQLEDETDSSKITPDETLMSVSDSNLTQDVSLSLMDVQNETNYSKLSDIIPISQNTLDDTFLPVIDQWVFPLAEASTSQILENPQSIVPEENFENTPIPHNADTTEEDGKSAFDDTVAEDDLSNAWRYLKLIDRGLLGPNGRRNREHRQSIVLSFYKHKLNEYEASANIKIHNVLKKDNIRESVRKYFGLSDRVIRRMFEPYNLTPLSLTKSLKPFNRDELSQIKEERRKKRDEIPARNIEDEVNAKIREYQNQYNIFDILHHTGSENIKEYKRNKTEAKKIIRYLRETGFSYHRIIELLGLKDDFKKNYLPKIKKQKDSANDAESTSVSIDSRTKKRSADQKIEFPVLKKLNKGKKPGK